MNMESLYDIEQAEINKKKKLDSIKNIIGRETNIPKRIVAQSVSIRKITNPHEVFEELGYIMLSNKTWIKKIDNKHRFHANITLDGKDIFIHCDKTIKGGRHRASEHGVDEERQKFKLAIHKRKPPSTRVKVEKLSQAEVQEALKKLREELHPIRTFFKKLFQ
jgi:hypothetical protein